MAARRRLRTMVRPSSRVAGSRLKSFVSSTNPETFLVARLPSPMAMPRWAFLRGSTSLTPSPTMATCQPRSFRASTISTFCQGETRPNTLRASMRSPASAAVSSSAPVTTGPASARRSGESPARGATVALTVSALSPERIFKVMHWDANSWSTFPAPGRTSSPSATSARGRRRKPSSEPAKRSRPGRPSGGASANSSTRRPLLIRSRQVASPPSPPTPLSRGERGASR